MIHPDPDIVDGEVEDEVEVILADRYNGSRTQCLVRFLSYGPDDDLWLPIKKLGNDKGAISDYWKRQKTL